MPRVWAGECKKCGKLSAVRHSETDGRRIDLPVPSRKTKVVCPHCGAENEFSDSELKDVSAEILRK
jgi:hypothetical protein